MEPMIYDGTATAAGDKVRTLGAAALAELHRSASERMVALANANEDYLDPNSIQVRVTVSARAL